MFGDNTSSAVWVTLLVVATLIFMRWSQRNLRARLEHIKQFQQPPQTMHSAPHPPTAGGSEHWHVSDHDLARDAVGQLDTRIAILQQLLRTSEEHIVRLEQAIERAERVSTPTPSNLPGEEERRT